MVYKRFYLKVLFQVVLLASTLLAFCWSVLHPNLIVTAINLAIISVLQIAWLLYYLNKVNRDLARFFESVRFQDTTVTFKIRSNEPAFKELYQQFNQVNQEFRELRSALEKDRFFYLNALNHIGVGLIVINQSGEILFSNKSFQKLLSSKNVRHIDNLKELKEGLPELIRIMDVNRKELVKMVVQNEVVLFSVRSSEFRLDNDLLKIISFQDIKFEIEQRELDAWQKLIRILTHEIMNSVSPITLTSAGIINLLEKNGQKVSKDEIDTAVIDNILVGLHAIRKRSRGLANFVEGYRGITHLPQPGFVTFSVETLFGHLEALMTDDLHLQNITLESSVAGKGLSLYADEKLIEQVLLNLIRNSIAALEEKESKKIKLLAFENNGQTFISVMDNGKGIASELLDTIFVPFFTTREHGSGIGLSLSREIMRMHGGYIKVVSSPGVETTFTLVF